MADESATPDETAISATIDAEAQAAADQAAAEAEAQAAAEAEAQAAAEAEAKAAAEAEAQAAAKAAAEAEAQAAAEAEAKAAAEQAIIGEPVEDVVADASSTDGTTPDNNGPPVEEYVPGVKVETTSDSATIAWPEFGLDENYVVQQEKNDGTWKTLDTTIEPSDTRDYEATIDGLKEGKDYTLRIVTADTPELAESATDDAVDSSVAGPGLGSMARAQGNGNSDVVASQTFTITPLALTTESGFQYTLEGCRADGSPVISLPNGDGDYICPDAAYTTGNLGKDWAELDLVPHRVTVTGNGTTSFVITADREDAGRPGYDIMSVPVVNTLLSVGTCEITTDPSAGTGAILEPGQGGADKSIYRTVTVTTTGTCVFDYHQRLALGSHLYPGASLHSNLLNVDFGTGGIGSKEVSIPVNEIEPQHLDKTMTATQGQDYNWTVSKSVDPKSLSFGDTCSVQGNQQGVTITVSWSRSAVLPNGDISIETTITATNPAARAIIASVSDVWYEGTSQTVEIASFDPEEKEVPARSSRVWTFTKVVSSTATAFNDVATATYKDKVYPDITIPGNTTATASATVALTGPVTDATATLSDAETISGSGYSYAVNSVTLNSTSAGSFSGGYTLGTVTTDPVTWATTLAPAGTGAASGSVVFNKTVHVALGTTGSGSLSDTATLKPADSSAQTDSKSVALSASKTVDLTVTKKAPNVFTGSDSATFTFELYKGTIENGESPLRTQSVTVDASSTISGGQRVETTTFADLEPGVYTVRELPQFGWTDQSDQEVDLGSANVVCTAGITFDNTLTELKGAPLEVSKDATPSYDRDYKWTIDKKVDPEGTQNVPQGTDATFDYSVEVQRTTTDSNFDVDGTIKVYNPNVFAVPVNSLEDKIGSQVCTLVSPPTFPYSLAGESTLEVGYDCDEVTGASATSTGTNKASATWPASVKVGYLTYSFDKTSDTGEADFDFGAATPTVTGFKTVTVTDPMAPEGPEGEDWSKTTADTDDLQTFTYSKSFSGTPGECTIYDNTATITETKQSDSESVEVCVGKDLVVTKDASGSYGREYLWEIDKSVVGSDRQEVPEGTKATFDYKVVVTQTGIEDSKATLGGTITVSNPNVWQAVTLDSVVDTTPGWTCDVDTSGGMTVPKATKVGEVVTPGTASFPYTCDPDQDAPYSGINTAKATWNEATYWTPSGSDEGTDDFKLQQTKSINATVYVGDPLAPGGEYLGSVTANDPPKDPATATFTYKLTWDGVPGTCETYDNTATIYSTYDESEGLSGSIGSDKATVEVCVGKDLTVSKTAAGTYDREYLWAIDKKADATEVSTASGDDYTFTYTVTVDQTGFTDSGWELSGKITVTNPNDWQDITADVSDAIGNGGKCAVKDGTDVTVAASASKELSYSCTFASKPTSYSGTNTATADWSNDEAAVSPSTSASGEAEFTLTQDESTNDKVNVTDTYAGDLGSVTATDTEPWAKAEFTYDRAESGVAGECTTYDNTATIVETEQSASEDVKLCVGRDLAVEKTATGGFDRVYQWAIDKLVNGEESVSVLADSDSETFNYSVTAYQTGFTDSGWTLGGTITVTNPNQWLDITADVTDAADIGGRCTVVDGEGVLVKAGESVALEYTCLFETAPEGYSGTNTATAAWSDAYPTPTTRASGQVEFTLKQRSATNQDVEIVDTLAGTLGSLTATDAPEFTSAVYEYPLTFDAPAAGECVVNPNTASVMPVIGEVDQVEAFGLAALDAEVPAIQPLASDSATAELCGGTLDKSANPAEGTAVQAGQVITYSITVTNPSGEAVSGQTLVDAVPAGVSVDEASIAPAGTYDATARTITWKFDLAAATIDDQTEDVVPGSATFTYKATVTAGFGSPSLVNTATWVERNLTDKTEHPVVWPILSLDKTADPAEGIDVSPGNTITYTVLVSNTGAGSFTGPMVDTLPDGFTADAASVTASGGVLSEDGRSITWTVTLAANSSTTFTYSGTVDLTATADLVNTVVLTTPTGPISDSTTHPIPPVSPVEDVEEPEEPVIAGEEDLAKTGAENVGAVLTAALLAMLAGGLMVAFGRRRRYNG